MSTIRTRLEAIRETHPYAMPAIVLIVLSFGVMAPSLSGDFLNWDDDRFVVNNPEVQSLTPQNLVHAFSGLRFESYQPLLLISYMVDGTLWPGRPLGYRLHNLVLYLISVSLLLWLFKRLGFARGAALAGCLFFALAPYKVESTAWIAGRKDVLMLLFALGAWHFHLAAHEGEGRAVWVHRGLSLLCFIAALLSKSSALVLPFMMGIVDVGLRKRPVLRDALLLAPFVLIAAGLAVVLIVIWGEAELIRQDVAPGALERLTLVGWTLGHYADTIAWPFRLSPLYAQPTPEMLHQGMLLGYGVVTGIALLLGVARVKGRSIRVPLSLFALFLVALGPFLNLVPMYYLVSDRYLLLPSIALALGVAAVYPSTAKGSSLSKKAKKRAPTGRPGSGRLYWFFLTIILLAYGVATVFEGLAWRDSESLWRHAVNRQPGAYYARLKLGETLRDNDNPEESAEQYRMALKLKPLSPSALGGLFWGSLLADAKEVHGVTAKEAEQMAYRFVAIANDGQKLLGLKRYLERQGLKRAARVVEERVYPHGGGRR